MGRRGRLLHLQGWAWAAYGIGVATRPVPDRFTAPGTVASILDVSWAESALWSTLWIGFGSSAAMCAVAAIRWPRVQTVGWGLAIVPPLAWAVLYVYSLLIHLISGGVYGRGDSWPLALYWILATLIIRHLADWDEPPPLAELTEDRP